ncbi:MAG: DUF484 family protein [Rhodocyclaceae bacterium]|jgi:uncharacterized protein YigA (DUF484 family)|nr:DUF484 family protein [Rhodocyclaceae bacterium]MBK6908297.1 DUF484 family protein [Rhodocyclaceae bacterium]
MDYSQYSHEEIARYLSDHPEFFDQYADLLALVTIPDPHTGRAISITERQLFTLRDKVRTLESKLSELIGFGEENDSISDKVHAMTVAMMAAADYPSLSRALYAHLGGAFAVPHVGMRLWGVGSADVLAAGANRDFLPVGDSLKAFAGGLQRPYCGNAAGQDSVAWFNDFGPHLKSMVQIPLRNTSGACFGLMVLASEDPYRFYPDLGTLYLERIAGLASAAFQRVLNA